jgi:hypothetical protein
MLRANAPRCTHMQTLSSICCETLTAMVAWIWIEFAWLMTCPLRRRRSESESWYQTVCSTRTGPDCGTRRRTRHLHARAASAQPRERW